MRPCRSRDRLANRTSRGESPQKSTVGTLFLHGGSVPSTPWQRRRTTDSPRPGGGRQWAGRLRRSGSLARQVLFAGRAGRRGDGNVAGATSLLVPAVETDAHTGRVRLPRLRMRRRDGLSRDLAAESIGAPPVTV